MTRRMHVMASVLVWSGVALVGGLTFCALWSLFHWLLADTVGSLAVSFARVFPPPR